MFLGCPPLLRCDSGVRALTLRDGVSDVLAPEAARRCYGWSARLCWEMALRDETPLSKLASGFGRRIVVVRPRGGMCADVLRGS